MSTEEYKKAYVFLSNKCSKKEISTTEALKSCSKFRLKIVEKNNLINELKKQNFINHERFSRFSLFRKFLSKVLRNIIR